MRLRLTLLIGLLAAIAALFLLLPRSPLVLGWLWNNASELARESGFRLEARRLSGNALAGVTIHGLDVSGPGIEFSSEQAQLSYTLPSLLRGRLDLGVELSGVRGSIDPDQLQASPATGNLNLPVNLSRLDLQDFSLTVSEYDIYLPVISVNELAVTTSERGIQLAGSLLTPDGGASFSGEWQPDLSTLRLDILSAEVRLARHWWEGATGGNVTGELRAGPGGVEFDAQVENGSIDYLDVQVDGISGPVTMRDLVINGQVAGTGLQGPVQATVLVDIPAESYRGVLTGKPRLEGALPWLGRTLGVDLQAVEAQGPMDLLTVVTGWEETLVTGQASGSGTVAGLPLAALHGTFDYRSHLGVSVDARADLAGGQLNLQLLPAGTEGDSELQVQLHDLRPLAAEPDASLSGQATINFSESGSPAADSSASLSLAGQLLGEALYVQLTGSSNNTYTWDVQALGSHGPGQIQGSAQLDFLEGRLQASLEAAGLDLPGTPWGVSAQVQVPASPLELPLQLTAAVQGGPVQLAQTAYLLDLTEGLELAALDGSLQLDLNEGTTRLALAEPEVLVQAPGLDPEAVQLSGQLQVGPDSVTSSLSGSFRDLTLTLMDVEAGVLSGTLQGTEHTLTASFDSRDERWQISGDLPVTAAGALVGVEAGGLVSGEAQGQGAEIQMADLSGRLLLSGQSVDVALSAQEGDLTVLAESRILGSDWQLTGRLWPDTRLEASSQLGTVLLEAGTLSGQGSYALPAGTEVMLSGAWQEAIDWQLRGSLATANAQLTAGNSTAQLDWQTGLTLTADIQQPLRLLGAELDLQASLAEDGVVAGQLDHQAGSLQLAGHVPEGFLRLDGSLPAATLHPQLAGSLQLAADYSWEQEQQLQATVDWLGLTAAAGWQPGQAIQLEIAATGLVGSVQAGTVQLQLTDFDPLPFLDAGSLPVAQLELSGSLSADLAGATGTFPIILLDLTADLLDGQVNLVGDLGGTLQQPMIDARLGSSPLSLAGALEIPALEFQLRLAEDGVVTATGPDIQLTLDSMGWHGSASLAFGLLGHQHVLELQPQGSPGGTTLQGGVNGALLSGRLSLQETVDFDLDLTGLADDVLSGGSPATFGISSMQLGGSSDLAGNWTARLQAAAHSPLAALAPLSLGAELHGNTTSASGIGNLRGGPDAARLLTINLESDYSSLQLTSDLASLDLDTLARLLGVDAQLAATGVARLEWPGNAGTDFQAQGDLTGQLAGADLQLELLATPERVQFGGLANAAPAALEFLPGPMPSLQADWGGASLQVSSDTTSTGTLYRGVLTSSAGSPVQLASHLQFDVAAQEGRLELLSAGGDLGPVNLQLNGQLLPDTQLLGEVHTPWLPDPLPVQVTDADGPLASTRLLGLELAAYLQQGALQIDAAGKLNGQDLVVDLGWNLAHGFTGSATGQLDLEQAQLSPVELELAARQDGELQLRAVARLTGQPANRLPVLELSAGIGRRPWQSNSLSGSIASSLNLADLLPQLGNRSLSFSLSGRLHGSLTDPSVSGSLVALGVLDAEGRMEADLSRATLQLSGPSLAAGVNLDRSGWQADLDVKQLAFPPIQSLLAGALLDLEADAAGNWEAGGTVMNVQSFALSGPQSHLHGSGGLQDGVLQADVQVDLQLADVTSPVALAGSASGSLQLNHPLGVDGDSGYLAGLLTLQGIQVAGTGNLAGSVDLSGTILAPVVNAVLAEPDADGSANDVLELAWQPASSTFRLTSQLELGAVATDLQLLSSPDQGQVASGHIRLPGGSFQLGSTTIGTFQLIGEQGYAGWELELDPSAATLQATGSLGSLGSALGAEVTGSLALTARLADTGVRVAGSLAGLSVAGIELGDVTIDTSTGSSPVVLISGNDLQGQLSLAGDWQLTRLATAITDDLSLVLSATGDLQGGTLNASIAGRLLDERLLGTATAQLGSHGLNLEASIELLGGNAQLSALHRAGYWQGTVSMDSLDYGGVQLQGTGGIFGELLSPSLELQTSATMMGLTGSGSLRLGRQLLEFDQTLTGGGLGGEVLLQGSLQPEPQLLLTGPDGNSFRLEQAVSDSQLPLLERTLSSSGQLHLQGNAASIQLNAGADGSSARLAVALPFLPGLAVHGQMRLDSLRAFLEQLEGGIQLSGERETFGSLSLQLLAGNLQLDGFGLDADWGRVELSGSLSLTGNARLSGQLDSLTGLLGDVPGLAGGSVPFAVVSSAGIVRFVSSSALGDIDADYNLASGQAGLTALLRSGGGTANVSVAWSTLTGLTGSVASSDLVLFELPGGPPGLLQADVEFGSGRATGTARLQLGTGQFTVAGNWGLGDLLPAAIATRQVSGGNLELRTGSFELSELPVVARFAPALTGGVTAVIQVRDDVVAGNLVASGLSAAGTPVPIEAIISGSPERIEIGGSLTGSPLSLTLQDGVLSGLLEMRRFPLQTLAEAAAGPLDVTAEVTGVTRFSLPLGNLQDSEVRVATEQVHLERSGVVTSGNLSMELSSGVLAVSHASFSGAGSWEAGGVLRADELDFTLEAVDADFGPMLGLIPALNQLGVAASGTVSLSARGSLADPVISLQSGELDFTLAGLSYRLDDLDVSLHGSQLAASAQLLATDPIQGSLSLSGSGGVSLSPLAFQNADFRFAGDLAVPFIGQLQGIRGAIVSADGSPGAPLVTEVEAMLGTPLRVSGSLTPIDLTVQGQGLRVDLPSIFLRESVLDVDLQLTQEDGFDLSGNVTILESLLSLNRGGGSGVALGGGIADSFRFDGLRIEAPARLRLAENFGTAELMGLLTVRGTLANPQLEGSAEAIRGTFQLAGRDFEVQSATARFDPSRGLYPELRFTATTSLDRNRLLPSGSSLQIVSPTDGPALVTLSFAGSIENDPEQGFRLNLDPVLSSNVLVQQVRSDGLSSAARPLNEDELLALITLGRTEFASLGGESGLAPSVAQGALETAVDLLIMSELQRALGEALGLDLVEIRSSALSSLLAGNGADQQFGISLRFGGYVSEEVFATYRVSAFDDPEGLYAFSNEIGIRYALGPVTLNLAGSLNLPEAQDLAAMAGLSLAVLYEVNPVTTIEAAFDLSSQEQQFRFGVTWRW